MWSFADLEMIGCDPHHSRGLEDAKTEGHGDKLYAAACKLGLEGIVSKKLNAPYRSCPSRTWIKVKNPKAPAATRAIDGTF
jgi:ATP-dependent DNA ligase